MSQLPRIRKDFASILNDEPTRKAILFKDFDGKEYWIPRSLCTLIKKKKECVIVTIAAFKFEEIENIKVEHIGSLFIDSGGVAKSEFISEEIELLPSATMEAIPAQQSEIERLAKVKFGFCFWDTGTGKTYGTLQIAYSRLKAGLIDQFVILCPASLQFQWKYFINYYYPDIEPHKFIVLSIHSASFGTSFERIRDLFNTLEGRKMLIIDESHLIKNQTAKRTRNIAKTFRCDYGICASATPIGKNAGDLYYQAVTLHPALIGFENYGQFQKNFLLLGGSDGEKVVAYKNTAELSQMLSPYVSHLNKSQIIEHLPGKIYRKHSYEMTGRQKKAYDKLQNLIYEFQDKNGYMPKEKSYQLSTFMQKVASGFIPSENEIKTIFENMGKLGDGAKNLALVSEIMYDSESNERLNILNDILLEIGNQKVIIWCHYIAEIDAVNAKYPNSLVLMGGLTQKKVQQIIFDFENTEVQYLIINQDIGAGFNLQFCNHAIYYSTTYDIIKRMQSEDRIWRKGQEKQCTIYDIVALNSIDERIQEVLFFKKDIATIFRNEKDIQ